MKVRKNGQVIDSKKFLAYAKNYERASKILLREILVDVDISKIQWDDPKMDDISLKSDEFGLYPTLYSVRHYFELQLKGLILANHGDFDKIKTHDLQKLLKMLENIVGESRISKELKQSIQKLHRYDFSSEGLRYPYDHEGNEIDLGSPEENISNTYDERPILVKTLQTNFSKVSRELENLEGDLEHEEEMRNEMMVEMRGELDSFS